MRQVLYYIALILALYIASNRFFGYYIEAESREVFSLITMATRGTRKLVARHHTQLWWVFNGRS